MEYANNPIARRLRDVAQVHLAGLGAQVFYTSYGPFDTHFDQLGSHTKLWMDVSAGIHDFFADLREHDASQEVVVMLFSEFGRRVRDNGTGTDHGAAGVAFAIGDRINGGMYGNYPSLNPGDLTQGDLAPNYDFRGFYSTLAEKVAGARPGAHRRRPIRANGLRVASGSFTGERTCLPLSLPAGSMTIVTA